MAKTVRRVTKIELPAPKSAECCGHSHVTMGLILFAFGLLWMLMVYGIFPGFKEYMLPLFFAAWGLMKVFM